MRNFTFLSVLAGAIAMLSILGCSGGNSPHVMPFPASMASSRYLTRYYSCPATGSLKYVSDLYYNVVNIYAGKLDDQSPCGRIASASLNGPGALYVHPATHDLYVVNLRDDNILVFHRGQANPYNTYTDPSGQSEKDVTVAGDGTILVSNVLNLIQSEAGSISTWKSGPNGGTFVGNFPMTNSEQGAYIAVKENGSVYFDDFDRTTRQGFVWTVSCPAGACGVQSQVAGVALTYPGGLGFDDTGDLVVVDSKAATVDTFELPDPKPSTFPLGGFPTAIAMGRHDHRIFVVDDFPLYTVGEYSRDGRGVGGLTFFDYSIISGVAVDP